MMNYLEKVRFLKEKKNDLKKKGDFITVDARLRENLWASGEIEQLQRDYPFLPQSYVDFIQEFDSLGLAWVVFYGSKNSEIISLEEELEYWKDKMKGQYFPFGKDPSGGVYVFNKTGEILFFPKDDYEWENEPQYIADNFENFINDCLLGKRYPEFEFTRDNPFYTFLQAQGWA